MKFLVVDDSATMRRILVNSLQRIGFDECVEVENARGALERFDASVGFVIAGRTLTDMSCADLARALRARPDGTSVPILMITTRSGRAAADELTGSGVTGCIVKPFTPHMLREHIDHALSAAPTPAYRP
jgi:two-component system, chemotaxis family, chemotaxis protein CheY